MLLAKHSLWYLFARGLPGLVNLATLFAFTRLLSPEDYGRYALVVAGASLGNAVLFQWLRLGLLRYAAAYRDDRDTFLSTILCGYLVLVGATGLLGALVVPFLADPVLRGLVALGLVLLWLEAFFALHQEMARIQFAPLRYGILTFARAALALLLGGLLAWAGYGAVGVIVGAMAGLLLPAAWHHLRHWRGARPSRADRRIVRQLLAYGLPLTATFALGFVVNSSDRFFLGWLLGAESAGLYAVGYDFAKQSLGMLMMVVNLAAYPLAVRALEEEGREAARRQLTQNLTFLLLIALPAGAGVALLAPNIAEVMLGAEFVAVAAAIIPWIALGAVLAGLKSYYLDLSFQLGNSTVGQIWVVLVAALLDVFFNLLWIPRYGLAGAAYATVAAYAAALVLSWAWGRRIFPLPFPGRDPAKILLATAGMSLALLPVAGQRGALHLALQVLWGGAVFLVLVLVLDVLGVRGRLAGVRSRMGGSQA